MARSDLPAKASNDQVQDFLRKVAMTPAAKSSDERGRLIFALDATASRGPTWDRASHLQAEMFQSDQMGLRPRYLDASDDRCLLLSRRNPAF
jgi:hypothetical protein